VRGLSWVLIQTDKDVPALEGVRSPVCLKDYEKEK